MPWSTTINPKDDELHPRSDDPYWNESHLLTFKNVEQNVMGTMYYWFRPNMKLAVGGPIVWDGHGQDIYNCRFYAFDQCVAMPENANMNDFTLESGLTVRTGELQKNYRYRYERPGVEIDLTFNALNEPYYMPLEKEQINPAIINWMTEDDKKLELGHYTQAGRVTGTLDIYGETIEIDGTSLRDHTWGPRKQLTNMPRMRGAWPFAVIDENNSFQCDAMGELPAEDDPIFGASERIVAGWHNKDGKWGELKSGTRTVLERAEDGRPLREQVVATDALGRNVKLNGEWLSWLKFPCYSDCVPTWGLCKWTFDDGRECVGEAMDYLYVRHQRRLWEMLQRRTAGVS
jgi:hypothetical protein